MSKINTPQTWRSSLIQACDCGDLNKVRELCQSKYRAIADLHADEELGFRIACSKGHLEVVKFLTMSEDLIKEGFERVNLHEKNEGGLITACFLGRLSIVKFLTSSRELKEAGLTWADPKAKNGAGLTWAIAKGHLEVVKYWFEDLNVGQVGEPLWRMAIQDGLMEAFEKESIKNIETTLEYCFENPELKAARKKEEWQEWKYWESAYIGGRSENLKWLIMRSDFQITETMRAIVSEDEEIKSWIQAKEEKEILGIAMKERIGESQEGCGRCKRV